MFVLRPVSRFVIVLTAAALVLSLVAVSPASASVRFDDVSSSSTFSADIDWLASRGVTKGCNPPANTRFCPEGFVTRGQMAAFLVRALGLPKGSASFSDTADSVFAADIAALADAGITKGCNPPANTRFCPEGFVTRGQMAAFLHRALPDLPAVVSAGANVVAPTSSSYQPSISADGRFVAFASNSSGDDEVMVYDRSEGTASNITLMLDGGSYLYPTISGDGRWVASYVANGDNVELWVTDRTTGTNHEVALVDGGGDGPDISHDGRYVVFSSYGDHIDPSADPNSLNLYRWDRQSGSFDRFSVDHSGGNLTQGLSSAPLISGDGSRAVFTSNSPSVATDTPFHMGIPPTYLYMHDFDSGTTSLVSRDEFGDPAPVVGYASFSADGATVAYLADIEDVMPSRSDSGLYLFIQDVASSALTQVPYPDDASSLNRTALSGDGTTLAYIANFGDDPNQLLAFHAPSSQTRVLSASSSGAHANQPVLANVFFPGRPALSDSGAWAAFTSPATNLGASSGAHLHVFVAEAGQ